MIVGILIDTQIDAINDQLTVPRCRRIKFGHRAFSVAGPMVWNSLPTEFRDLSVGFGVLGALLRRYNSRDISASGAIDVGLRVILRYINFLYLSVCLSVCLFIYLCN